MDKGASDLQKIRPSCSAKKKNPIYKISRSCVLLSSFFFFALTQAEVQEKRQLRLPVRLLKGTPHVSEMGKEDFTLLINNRASEIVRFQTKQRSLLLQPDLGRSFILSFRLADYGPFVERELAYFVSEILNTADRLFLLTPLKMYRLKVSPRKERIKEEIRELLEKDLGICREERAAAERKLIGSIDQLKRAFDEDVRGAEIYKKTALFLNTFPGEFLRFQERYLAPDPAGARLLLEHLAPDEGERWWIHFEQHQDSRLFSKIQEAVHDIQNHVSSLEAEYQEQAQVMRTGLAEIEQGRFLPDSLGPKALSEAFLGYEVNYNVIIFRNLRENKTEFARTPFPHLESLHVGAAQASGGTAVIPGTTELGMKAIASHPDNYCELAFDWDGVVEEKRIRVLAKREEGALSYSPILTSSQIQNLAQSLSQEKIRIGGTAVAGKDLSFYIQAFTLQGEDSFGLVKVRVQLFDERNQNIFDQAHTLRATKDKVFISLPLPKETKGKFWLQITACDLIANRLATD